MHVKQYSPLTEQPHLDWIKRFIHFHGKRHRQRSRPTFGTKTEFSLIARGRRAPTYDRNGAQTVTAGFGRLPALACFDRAAAAQRTAAIEA
jgi:hypothetical protein